MASLELDPMFVKALKLLHSRNKDSAAQLKAMLDDVIAQRRDHKGGSNESEKPSKNKQEEDTNRKRDAEKRNFEKNVTESSQDSKKPRLDSQAPSEKESSKSSREKEKEREKEKQRKEKEAKEKERKLQEKKERERERAEKERQEREKEREKKEAAVDDESTDEERSMDADDFAFDLGISCVVCRQFDVSSGNQLVECQECHNLYHQECHRPPVTEQDVNDPRFVWYCSRCSKSMKKMQASKPSKPKSSSSSSAVAQSKESPPLFTKPSKTDTTPANVLPFRRMDAKTAVVKEPTTSKSVSSKESGNSKPLSGLASLAANLAGKSETAKPKVSESSKKTDKFSSKESSKLTSQKSESGKTSSQKSDHSEKSSSSSKSSSSKSSSSSTSVSSSGSGKQSSGSAPSTAAASADKRLQMMKKKAAAKLHEKKVHLK
ncbi:integrator complex subunit 12-like isoform X2 [Haliotis asinina]|uniref:integrator complex subunit 12-like isoform X2 n=1 Tax=Haliotis asinina TaxID=109174 RepID=UPI00353262DD